MSTQDTYKTKEEIIKFLQINGPNLPIQISKHIKMDSLFASAFLSELLSEQKIKLSNMKIGTSPIYYIPGTEARLEKFSGYLKPKEKEAFDLLKKNNFLIDETQQPAIRIALRNIKDFAKAVRINEKIIWRYFLTPISEYKEKPKFKNQNLQTEGYNGEQASKLPSSFVSSIEKTMQENKSKEVTTKENKEEKIKKEFQSSNSELLISKPILQIQKKESKNSFHNPLATKIEIKKEEKQKSPFCIKIIELIEKNKWNIVQELVCKTKEYNALIQINSDLGPIIFKLQAKNKKTVSEGDLVKLLGEAQSIPLPALFISYGEPKKKVQEFLNKYLSVIKYKQLK